MGYERLPYDALINDAVHVIQNNSLSFIGIDLILDNIIWGWTTHTGKYCGCPLWSEKALEKYLNRSHGENVRLHHEHTTPRIAIKCWLLSLGPNCTYNDVLRILTEFAVSVVMLPEEHKALNERAYTSRDAGRHPPSFDPNLLLSRYENCSAPIKVMYVPRNAINAIPVTSITAWAQTVLTKANKNYTNYIDYETNADPEIQHLWQLAMNHGIAVM